MVMEIASEAGVNENSLLADEIVLLSKKLEDVKSALTTINNVTIAEKRNVFIEELTQTENSISSIKDDLQSTETAKIGTVEQVHKLQIHLQTLTQTDAVINHLRTEQAEILSDPETSIHREKICIVELLQSWQEVFRETFQQYHRVFSSIAGDRDSQEAIRLWKDYLMSIQEFLQTRIPDNYDNLDSDQQMCELHESLLTSQNVALLNEKTKHASPNLNEQFNLLTAFHNETLSNIKKRHDEVRRRLELWQHYQSNQKSLLSWLRRIENEQSRLNLRYLHLRTINTNLRKIQDLLTRIPQGDELIQNLRAQHSDLLSGCSQAVCTSVRVELDATEQRIRNLEAALRTWHEYLDKIKNTFNLYELLVGSIDEMFLKIQSGVEQKKNESSQVTYSIPVLQNRIQLLKSYQEELSSMDEELDRLSSFEEKLMEAIDTKDAKAIKQRNWLLKQQQNDIKYQITSLIVQLEERLGLWDRFDHRRLTFLTWSQKLNERLEEFSSKLNYPEVVLRRLELEYCFEVDVKRAEFEWLVKTGICLAEYESDEQAERFCRLADKVTEIRYVWEKMDKDTKGEVEKVKNIIKEMKLLKADSRQLILWMRKMSSDLNKMVYFNEYDDNAILEKLNEHKIIEDEISVKSVSVSNIVNRGERFIMDCDNCNIYLDIKSFILNFDVLERKWSSLQVDCGETKNQIYATWKLIRDVLSICKQEEPWLTMKEEQNNALKIENETVSSSDNRIFVEKLSVLISDINEHASQFKQLEESYAELLTKNNIKEIPIARELLERFAALKISVAELSNALDENLQTLKEFESCYTKLILKLTQLDAKLTQLQHLDDADTTEKSTNLVQDKMTKLTELKAEHAALETMIEQANSLKTNLLTDAKCSDSDRVLKMANEYSRMSKDIQKRLKTLKQFYKKQLSKRPSVNEEVQVNTLKFVKDFAAQVETLPKSLLREDAFLFDLRHIVKETKEHVDKLSQLVMNNKIEEISKVFASCQSSVDLINHYIGEFEAQGNTSADDDVLCEARELTTTFQRLTSSIHFRQQQHTQQLDETSELGRLRCPECSERNWSQLNNDIWRVEKWLDHAEGTLLANPVTPPENIEQLVNMIQEHKEFRMYLESHRDVIRSLNIVGEHLMEHSSGQEQSVILHERLLHVNERWKKVQVMAMAWQAKLHTSLMENSEFLSIIEESFDWMDETEKSIRNSEPVDVTEEIPIMRKKYDKFRKLHREMQKCEVRVASLQEANRVCAYQQQDQFEHLQEQLSNLWLRLKSLTRLTRIYMLKLGPRLGYDTNELYEALNLQSTASMTTLQDLSGENITESMDRPDSSLSNVSNDNELQPILTRSNQFLRRVFRATALILVVLGVTSLYPRNEEEYSCATSNNLAWSLEPILRYPNGPPPT